MLYKFKIELCGLTSSPDVWRTVLVPDEFTFDDFHALIQAAFGWGEQHQYYFVDDPSHPRMYVMLPDLDIDSSIPQGKISDADEITVDSFFRKKKQLFYIYDLGDNWIHRITLLGTVDEPAENFRCEAGNGTCPPENCGGAQGYENLKQIFREHPSSDEANDYRQWLGAEPDEDWDPDYFDLDETNQDIDAI
jgi:hypothetical protein